MKYSIKAKMTLLVAVIIVAMMGSMLLASFFLAEPFMISRQKANIRDLYRSLSSEYSDDTAVLAELLRKYEDSSFLQVEIFSQNGSLIYTSGRRMDEGFGGFRGGLVFDRFDPSRYTASPQVQRSGAADREMLMLYGLLTLEDGTQRYISIETPVEAISGTVQVLNILTLIISVLVAAAGCLVAWIYASKFSRPIIEISRNAKQVAALDFSHRADIQSSTAEIADLAVSINAMSGQLETFINQLMEKNRQLAEDNLRLAREEEMRRSFVANVSHDLKSPLAVLGGYAEMLKEHTEGIDPEACYDVIIEETAVMNEMIRSMLDVSALENGLRELKTVPLELGEWLTELTAREQPLMEKKGLSLSDSFASGLTVQADPETLARAVLNIYQNAKAHTPPGGRIEAALLRSGNEAVFSVYNDGENIPADKLDKIWDSFYKTDEARTRDEQNNVGLGLYIVKTITTAHGGRCGAINEEKGVRFWIALPLLKNS
ncbi:MAG: HAMP domain-containing histidine kinase [Clostridia bacterium]|nr:HAMP domain-containing histidine kinase [Clostridia bacterium]